MTDQLSRRQLMATTAAALAAASPAAALAPSRKRESYDRILPQLTEDSEHEPPRPRLPRLREDPDL